MTQDHIGRSNSVFYRSAKVNNLEIFYREAGSPPAPTVLLLHGFPTSSHMFRNLIPVLAKHYHVIAPDYPGFGQSSMPSVSQFEYSFDNLARVMEKFIDAINLKQFSLYVMDYGAPIGFRIAAKKPQCIQSLIIQNGNAYEEGLDNDFWKPFRPFWKDKTEANSAPLKPLFEIDATKWQYHTGVRNLATISPDGWIHDQAGMDRPGNKEIQLELFHSYGTNSPLYPTWQKYFRDHQPPTLIVWGKNDQIFPIAGAEPYKRDLKNLEFHYVDTGHFALEEDGETIANLMLAFLKKEVPVPAAVC
ncbi:MAG: alpha/beta hydrolase [Candidatus Melainabacteria bacterium]|nr:alpha/beta hydrolase [Candidatus Melainabacteria bacterium]